MEVVVCGTAEISAARLSTARQMLNAAFAGRFDDDDWAHGLGGTHAMILEEDDVVAHASVVERMMTVGSREVRVGYVEAAGVVPALQGRGLGSAVVAALNSVIDERFELGMLSTGAAGFYERLGWERWRGPTWVVDVDGRRERTADEDDGIMVYRTKQSLDLDTALAITCESRAGDFW